MEDHSGVGQGTVMLDIGGEIGALVVTAGADLEGVEIEIRPTGDTPHADPADWSSSGPAGAAHTHPDGTTHTHDDDRTGTHDDGPTTGHGAGDAGPHLLHVGVHHRPDGTWSAVFPELHEGTYELHRRPDGPVELAVEVRGGEVSAADWPTTAT